MDADIKNTHTTMKVKSEEYHKLFGHHWMKTNGVTWCTMCGEEKDEVYKENPLYPLIADPKEIKYVVFEPSKEVQPRALDGPLYNLPKGETK